MTLTLATPPDKVLFLMNTIPEKALVGAEMAAESARHDDREMIEDGARALDTVPLLAETLSISKRAVVTGETRISTRTETYEDIAEVKLERSVVDVVRVPIGQIVDDAPKVRTEGDTTIVPVLEERFVVVKQLFLKEELHIRHHVEHDVSSMPVTLRRQTAVVERLDQDGRVLAEPISEV